MDTSLICAQLNKDMAGTAAATEQNNTVFLLSTAIYHDIAKIQEQLGSGAQLLFEPAGICGNEFFCFLAGLNVGIIASNQTSIELISSNCLLRSDFFHLFQNSKIDIFQEVLEAAGKSHTNFDSILLGENVIDDSLYNSKQEPTESGNTSP
eukprot:sb/3473466/